jgi:hypothetical protein
MRYAYCALRGLTEGARRAEIKGQMPWMEGQRSTKPAPSMTHEAVAPALKYNPFGFRGMAELCGVASPPPLRREATGGFAAVNISGSAVRGGSELAYVE